MFRRNFFSGLAGTFAGLFGLNRKVRVETMENGYIGPAGRLMDYMVIGKPFPTLWPSSVKQNAIVMRGGDFVLAWENVVGPEDALVPGLYIPLDQRWVKYPLGGSAPDVPFALVPPR